MRGNSNEFSLTLDLLDTFMDNVADIYELSPMQQGMLFQTLFAPESGMYFEQRSCLLKGHLDVKAFKQAWQKVVDRYSVLRTGFYWEDMEKPLQIVYQELELPWVECDWRSFSSSEIEVKLDEFLLDDRQKGFDLTEAFNALCFNSSGRKYLSVHLESSSFIDGRLV